ncbi:hypothetical protein VPH35_102682 [Triticum aestivum]
MSMMAFPKKNAFLDNGLDSRVITTTRIQNVAKACCSPSSYYIFKMKPLSNEDSRRLFFGRIFNSEEACPHQLRDVSTEILKKCDGMLANESFDQEEWKHVRNSLGSVTNFTLEGMRNILDLSYKNLPPHLKTCLLYLGMYPEDFGIGRSHLELQWIAEGFVPKENGQDAEKVARSYFNKLVNRSLIQPTEFDDQGIVTKCKVHDTMLDLILSKCREENFLTILDDPQAITKLDYKVRRLSLHLDGPSDGAMFSRPELSTTQPSLHSLILILLPGKVSMSQIRTVMIFGDSHGMPPLCILFLYIHVYGHAEVDLTGLCKLYQLKYLGIDAYAPYKLPVQIRGLRHLETLDAIGSMNIPSDIVHLPCLMFLSLDWSIHPLPDGIGRMKSLRYLNGFELTMNSLDNIEDLGELTNLRDITVYGVSSLADSSDWKRRMDALTSSLGKNCISLENLELLIDGCNDALMALSPPPRRLERLVMVEGFFSRVPNWMEELNNLKELEITVLRCYVGILAELPALTHLHLSINFF